MQLLDSTETAKKLVELADSHRKIAFAVAWASFSTPVFEGFCKNHRKITRGVIGTHFHQTDWRVLDWVLNNRTKIQFMFDDRANSVFHPKVYLFWTSEKWEMLIGSANLTTGGMANNTELTLHLSGRSSKGTGVMQQATKRISEYWRDSVPITQSRLSRYKKQHFEMKKRRGVDSRNRQTESALLSWTWEEYCENLIAHPGSSIEGIESCFKLLKVARKTFADDNSFGELEDDVRRVLAGSHPPKEGDFADLDIGYFGFTKAYGNFSHLIKENDKYLSEAVNQIPVNGAVYRSEYMKYVKLLKKALEGKRHGLGVAARLLTIKRPDTFITWNGRNKVKLKQLLGITPMVAPTEYERYWDEVVVPISESNWYQSPKPPQKRKKRGVSEVEIWLNRVAMLDVLCW